HGGARSILVGSSNPTRTVTVHLRIRRRTAAVAIVAGLALMLVPVAGATSYIYWWQRNMAPNGVGYDRMTAHNHSYNELYFGPNAGCTSKMGGVKPAAS